MKSNEIIEISKINPKEVLQTYCNTHHKKHKVGRTQINFFRQIIGLTDEDLREGHNCVPYLVTVTFPRMPDLQYEWVLAGQWIHSFKEYVSKTFFVVGGLVVVEPHKNSTLKSKRGKNTKAGRPHFHMILWIAHPELTYSITRLKRYFTREKILGKVDLLPADQDVLKAAAYITKEKGNPDVNLMCRSFLGWENSINIWINQPEVANILGEILTCFGQEEQAFITKELYMNFPTAKRRNDKALLLAEIYGKVFTGNGWAVRGESIYRRIPKTRYSWEYWMELNDWIAQAFDLNMPPAYLEILKDNALWIAKQGATKKLSPKFELFPTLIIMLFIIEFRDCVYELKNAIRMPLESVSPRTSSVCYVDSLFDDCEPPYTILGLLYTIINWGREQVKDIQLLEQPEAREEARRTKLTRTHQMRTFDQMDLTFIEALRTFGGLYHPQANRKTNPALYVVGEPNSYKTTLLNNILEKLVGRHNIDVISTHKSQFNLGHLRKPDGAPFVLICDDHRWDQFGIHEAQLLNLLDGKFVRTEQKYAQGQQGELEGVIAFTSNQNITDAVEDPQLSTAIHSRVKEVTVWKPNKQYYQIPDHAEFFEQLEKEAIGFSIFSNAVFLASRDRLDLRESLPLSFFSRPQFDYSRDRLAYAGERHLKMVLEHLQGIQQKEA